LEIDSGDFVRLVRDFVSVVEQAEPSRPHALLKQCDLGNSLVTFDAGNQAQAIWQWKFDIAGHCGDHIVDALRSIHRAVSDHMSPDYAPD
jgi:hypothetical protein